MLKKLSIKNVALIDGAEIEFGNQLNVLSGETGAGKSVIIESLNFVLGAKADKTLIRSGETECFVKAEFDISDIPLTKDVFNDCDIEYDDLLIITRKLNIDGKNVVKINGNSANLSMLKRITSILVEVHGQSEHFHLLKASNQLQLLDKFSGDEVQNLHLELKQIFNEYNNVLSDLNNLGGDESQRLLRLDILNYQIDEIERVNLQECEEEELLSIKQKLQHKKKICDSLGALNNCITQEGGISDILSNSLRLIQNITDCGKEYADISERVAAVFAELDDISLDCSSLLDNFENDDFNLNEIEERLESIKQLKRKYGNNYNEICLFLDNAKLEKDKLENFNELAEKLLITKEKLEQNIYNLYKKINQARKKSADILTKNILEELKDLGMEKAKFIVKISDFPTIENCKFSSKNGVDDIEFLFSANPGEPVKPLSAVISGGEMSRFMLSFKAQTAKYSDISTFIFDEIDAGISGLTAKIVAEKLLKISRKVQVIVISHLPQISAMADTNLLIEKNNDGERAITKVSLLDYGQKIKEIARLLSGKTNSDTTISHAKELISDSEKLKNKLYN